MYFIGHVLELMAVRLNVLENVTMRVTPSSGNTNCRQVLCKPRVAVMKVYCTMLCIFTRGWECQIYGKKVLNKTVMGP